MFPNLELETELLADFKAVIGIDEVGRGAIAGPITVGVAVVTREQLETMPSSVQDSKLIAETKRPEVAAAVQQWAVTATGSLPATEIERIGINQALAKSALDALSALDLSGAVILLDGSANWLSELISTRVVLRTKADRDCGSVAAASVVAKVHRDQLMRELHQEHPKYGWDSNKGYASNGHIAALKELGPTPYHRLSWLGNILTAETQLFD